MHGRRRAAGLAAVAVSSLLLATGCSGDDVTEKAIEQATGSGVAVDIDSDTDEVTVSTSEGTVSTGSDLPDDYPIDAVPLVDSDVVTTVDASDSGQVGWSVSLEADGTVEEVLDQAADLLVAAGFTEDEQVAAVTGSRAFESDAYTVMVTAYDMGGRTGVQYVVVAAS